MKRVIILMGVLTLTAWFVSCSKDGASASGGAGQAGGRNLVTIKLFSADEGVTFDPANDKLAELIRDKFGIIFDAEFNDDSEAHVLLAASGALPDVFYSEPLYYITNYLNFIDQGYVKEIPQAILDKYPNVKNIIETSDICVISRDLFGGNYLLPKPDSMDRSLYIAERRGIFYRKDWAAKFGITEPPSNWEDLYTLLRHFTFDDPDGNGVKDTWGISTPKAGEMRNWFISWGINVSDWIEDTDGVWRHGQLSNASIEPLKFFRRLYEEGILDPEFAQIDYRQTMQKLAGGAVGAITRNADTDWINAVIVEQFASANPEGNPFDKVGLIPILSKDKNSKPYMHKYMLDMTGTQFGSNISDEKLDRYLEFHNWAMSEEGKSYKLGFEGVTWEKNAEGDYQYIKDSNGQNPVIAELYKSVGLLNMPSWGFELACDFKWPMERYGIYASEVRELSAWARAQRNPYAVPVNIAVKLVNTPAKMEADSFNFSNAVAEIIMGKEPVETMFAAMVKKAMDSGHREAIEDVNRFLKEKGLQ
ncbi:MAG: extracellular solute-binding protein [Spirochaetaceae bacterium]|jgi:ABC-type glycerol-3-phosphate transport system substrate-binding protein|nr:extracellular solute-binding protein [Spirochaetaceae bacterium]